MNKQTLNQLRQDSVRLENAADRLRYLRDTYMNTLDDLRIAQQGLKLIATWAMSMRLTDPLLGAKDARCIHDRAMDTLALISVQRKDSGSADPIVLAVCASLSIAACLFL